MEGNKKCAGVSENPLNPCLRSPDPDLVFFIRSFQDGLRSDGDFGESGGELRRSDLGGRGSSEPGGFQAGGRALSVVHCHYNRV